MAIRISFPYLILFSLLLAVISCSDSGDGDCESGITYPCVCATGGAGTTCQLNDGTYSQCVCNDGAGGENATGGENIGGEFGSETPEGGSEECPFGNLQPCVCPDASNGTACPDEAGNLGECECEAVDEPTLPCEADADCPVEKPYCGPAKICLQCTSDTQCAAGEFCLNGNCSSLLCNPLEKSCNGNNVQICNAEGTNFEIFECDPGTCVDGECTGCTPGTKKCLTGNVVECAPDGSGYNLSEECDALSQCLNGTCLECFPGQGKCEGSDAWQCAPDGSAWEFYKTCTSSEVCISGSCQSLCSGDIKFNTNVGCDYWAVDLDNAEPANNSPFALVVSNTSEQSADITIRKTDGGPPEASASVAPGQLHIFELPPYNVDGTFKGVGAWRVNATAPIVAYQFNPLENNLVYSNDASVLFPANAWGSEYMVMSRFQVDSTPFPFRSFFTVVAGYAQTEVTVVISEGPTLAGPGVPVLNAGETFTTTLEPYEILNIQSDASAVDLTGTQITSNQPVAVFGGHEAAVSSDQCCADHLEQQLMPINAWGKTYVASKSASRGVEKDYWRILAAHANTTVITTPNQGFIPTLNEGEYWDIASDQNFLIESNNPVLVGQVLASSYEINGSCSTGCQNGSTCFDNTCIMNMTCSGSGQGTCPNGHACVVVEDLFGDTTSCEPIGDPALILAVPVEQFRDEYIFLAPNNYLLDYLNIIAPSCMMMMTMVKINPSNR